jgi:hypothetical protein
MARVVPSQIASLIDQNRGLSSAGVAHETMAVLSAITRLVDELPTELLTISGNDYQDLVCGVEAINNAVEFWKRLGRTGSVGLMKVNGKHPLILIRDALQKCPDQAPSPTTVELLFISDAELRDSIRLDVSSAAAALHNGDWKAATVLAGAAAEALLLWSISKNPGQTTIVARPKGSPEDWGLGDYIRVALALGSIKDATAKQATLAKDFRNLIHPGRAQRFGEICDRARL